MLCTPSLRHSHTLLLQQFHGLSDCITMAHQTCSTLVSVTQLWPSRTFKENCLVFPHLGDCFRLASIVKLEVETVQVALLCFLWMVAAPCLTVKPHIDLWIEMSDSVWVPFPLRGPLGLFQPAPPPHHHHHQQQTCWTANSTHHCRQPFVALTNAIIHPAVHLLTTTTTTTKGQAGL